MRRLATQQTSHVVVSCLPTCCVVGHIFHTCTWYSQYSSEGAQPANGGASSGQSASNNNNNTSRKNNNYSSSSNTAHNSYAGGGHYRPFSSEDELHLASVLSSKPRHVARYIRQSMLHSRRRIAQFRNSVTYLMILLQSRLQRREINPDDATIIV